VKHAKDSTMHQVTRDEVRARAAVRGEYCHLPQEHVVTPFQTEHVVAVQHRGSDALVNLAYACLRCNLHKGPNLSGIDPKTRRLAPLFNPRRQSWRRHFHLVGALIVGKTAVGRTTVEVLAMNDLERIVLRQELLDQGLWPVGE
jgi:hypothetical protein